MRFDQGLDLVHIRAYNTTNLGMVLKEDNGGHCCDAVVLSTILRLVHINFDKNSGRVLPFETFEDWCQCLARPTPVDGAEIRLVGATVREIKDSSLQGRTMLQKSRLPPIVGKDELSDASAAMGNSSRECFRLFVHTSRDPAEESWLLSSACELAFFMIVRVRVCVWWVGEKDVQDLVTGNSGLPQ